ncbi:hypothetical protein D918_08597 [Trichuris suis]|nr:hypothetical protein D918_08597 [Trichuris suis]
MAFHVHRAFRYRNYKHNSFIGYPSAQTKTVQPQKKLDERIVALHGNDVVCGLLILKRQFKREQHQDKAFHYETQSMSRQKEYSRKEDVELQSTEVPPFSCETKSSCTAASNTQHSTHTVTSILRLSDNVKTRQSNKSVLPDFVAPGKFHLLRTILSSKIRFTW